jgi:hypothetical protein
VENKNNSNMKILNYLIILTFGLLSLGLVQAQDTESIALFVVVPEQDDDFYTDQLRDRLETKLNQVAANEGVSGEEVNPRYVLTSRVDLVDFQAMATAPPKYLAQLEVNLIVVGYNNEIRFGQTSMLMKGVGRSQEEAYYKAINAVSSRNPKLKSFITKSKAKIIEHYEAKCENIMAEADRYIGMQEFGAAIGLMMEVPVEAKNCYEQLNDKAVEAYTQYVEQNCEQIVLQAKAAAANRNFSGALAHLMGVKAFANCASKAEEAIDEIGAKVDEENRRQWDLRLRMYETQIDMERARYLAIRELAMARYQNRVRSVNFSDGW